MPKYNCSFPKKIVIITLFIILAVGVSSCGKEPIIIGFTGNLTGTSSEIAVQSMYGVQLAIEDFNSSGGVNGHEIELVIEDDGNTQETAVEADKRIVEQGAVAIIGHTISGVASLAVDYINEEEIVMVSPTISSSSFAGSDDYFYTMVPISEYQSQKITETMVDLSISNPIYLYQEENELFSLGFINNTESYAQQIGIETEFKSAYSQLSDNWVYEMSDRISDSDGDAVVIAGSSYDTARLAQVLRNAGNQIPIFTSTWSMTSDLITIAGPAAEGIYSINTYDNSSLNQKYIEFRDKYLEKYDTEPTFASVYSYEATVVLLTALEKAKSLDGPSIKAALATGIAYEGLQGDIFITENGDAIREMHLYQVREGKFVKVE